MASTYLTRTFGSAGNRQSWTWSGWIKKTTVYNNTSSSDREVWFGGYTANNNTDWVEFGTQGDVLYATSSGLSTTSTQVLRDVNGWYHAVVNYNGSNLKFYINGDLWNDSTDFSGNLGINTNGTHTIGAIATNQSSRRFTGLMSHIHFVDGTIYTPSDFGETDSTTGEWKIKTDVSVTYGTNGFFILKDGNSVTDQSGNSNNFTVGGGTLTKTEDNPSNVFATWNPNLAMNSTMTLANGNTTGTTGSNYAAGVSNSWFSTLGMSSGKYYAEFKYVSSTTNDGSFIGVGYDLSKQQQGSTTNAYNFCQSIPEGYGYAPQGEVFNNGSTSGYSTYTTGDIIGVAIDCDNNTLNFYKNGASAGSQINITADKEYFFALSDGTSANTFTYSANFGNGYFGTTAVASAGTNASGNGIFEYDVPTGYTALSTKGLNL